MLLFFQLNGSLAFMLCILKKSVDVSFQLAVLFGSYLLFGGSGHDQFWKP